MGPRASSLSLDATNREGYTSNHLTDASHTQLYNSAPEKFQWVDHHP
jgi:hypothetical protein